MCRSNSSKLLKDLMTYIIIFISSNFSALFHYPCTTPMPREIRQDTISDGRNLLTCLQKQPVCQRLILLHALLCHSGPGNSVGIATAYGLSGPGIESRWGEIFRTSPDRPWDPPSLLYNEYRVFSGGKVRPGRDADPSPPSSAEVKNRVELYLCSP